jgi:hypothetical protein
MKIEPHVVRRVRFVGRAPLREGESPASPPILSVRLDTATGIRLDLVFRADQARQLRTMLRTALQSLD